MVRFARRSYFLPRGTGVEGCLTTTMHGSRATKSPRCRTRSGAIAAARSAVLWIFRKGDGRWYVRLEGDTGEQEFADRQAAQDFAKVVAARCRSYRVLVQQDRRQLRGIAGAVEHGQGRRAARIRPLADQKKASRFSDLALPTRVSMGALPVARWGSMFSLIVAHAHHHYDHGHAHGMRRPALVFHRLPPRRGAEHGLHRRRSGLWHRRPFRIAAGRRRSQSGRRAGAVRGLGRAAAGPAPAKRALHLWACGAVRSWRRSSMPWRC